jgi:hypothetical protein
VSFKVHHVCVHEADLPRVDDCKKLYKDWNVSVRGVVDVSLLARSVDSQWKGSPPAWTASTRTLLTALSNRELLEPTRSSPSGRDVQAQDNEQEAADVQLGEQAHPSPADLSVIPHVERFST